MSDKMLIRPHRGSLAESMSESQEIDCTMISLAIYIYDNWPTIKKVGSSKAKDLIEHIDIIDYGYDKRIGWHTYLISIPTTSKTKGVFGMINKLPIDYNNHDNTNGEQA